MYVRFLRIRVGEDRLWDFQRFYRERVVPGLQSTPGCLFASLLQPAVPGGECISMTLWKHPESARAYEDGGLFGELLEESRSVLALAGDGAARRAPPAGPAAAARAPRPEGYEVVAGGPSSSAASSAPAKLHVRIVTLRVEAEQASALADRYRCEIVPALLAVKGCVGAFLAEDPDRPRQALSVTLWEREEDAVRYEVSGAFDALTERLKDTLSGLYQWKHSISATVEKEEVTGGDLHVDRYSLVVGQTLHERED